MHMPTDQQQHDEKQDGSPSADVERPSQFQGPPDQFLNHMLQLQCQTAPAAAAAVLRISAQQQVEVLALWPGGPKQNADTGWLAQIGQAAGQVLQSQQTAVVALPGDDQLYGQQPSRHAVLIPLSGSSQAAGLASYRIDTSDESELAQIRQRLELTTNLLGLYEMRCTLEQRSEQLARLHQSMEILASVNQQERFMAAAMALCNEIATKWNVRRVSLGFLQGRYVKAKAISHTEHLARKMQLVSDIEAAMEESLDQDIEILYPAGQEEPYVSRAAGELSSRQGNAAVCSLPLRRVGDPFAVLTVECEADQSLTGQQVETLRLTCDLCSPRLWQMYEHDQWLGAKAASGLRRLASHAVGPRHTWVKLAIVAVVALIAFMTFAQGYDRVQADFVIQPVQRLIISAPFDGRLAGVNVGPGDEVIANTTILGRFDTSELEMRKLEEETKRDGYMREAVMAMRDGKPDEVEMARLRAQQVNPIINRLSQQIQQATLRSSLSGLVTSEDLQRQLNAPFSKSDVLFEVAPLDELRAELLVPEKRIADIAQRQEGQLATASDPGTYWSFTVVHIDPIAQVVEQDNVFRVEVDFQTRPPDLRPGMTGVAKVHVGQRSYGYLWLRDLVDWVRMKLWL
jgi:hypothetical protein